MQRHTIVKRVVQHERELFAKIESLRCQAEFCEPRDKSQLLQALSQVEETLLAPVNRLDSRDFNVIFDATLARICARFRKAHWAGEELALIELDMACSVASRQQAIWDEVYG